jgi:hypothetical protein
VRCPQKHEERGILLARRQTGTPTEKVDALIAATALAAGASIDTRDIGGFAGCSLTVIDPSTASCGRDGSFYIVAHVPPGGVCRLSASLRR